MLTIFLTAYLYDLIEIDSQKVVFKIKIDDSEDDFRGGGGHVRSKRPATFFRKNDVQSDDDHGHHAQHGAAAVRGRKYKTETTADPKALERKRLEEEAERLQIEIDKNVSRLFYRVERFNYQIRYALNAKEIENLFSIKKYHENLINERNRAMREQRRREKQERLKEEEKQQRAQQNDPVNDNAQNAADGGGANQGDNKQQANAPPADDAKDDDYSDYTEDDGKVLINQLAFGDSITRELMVKFLQLEKHRLSVKLKTDNITSVKTLIDHSWLHQPQLIG